jgi:hypothetical protein
LPGKKANSLKEMERMNRKRNRSKKYVLLLLLFFTTTICTAQTKAYILANQWTNELDGYNPQQYFDKLYTLLKTRLPVKEIIPATTHTTDTVTVTSNEWVKAQIQSRFAGNNAFFLVMDHYLKVPAINLNKLFFNNAQVSSKLIFSINVYNADGVLIGSDTMTTRGCIVSKVAKENGVQRFYNSYKRFIEDMDCHLALIRQQLLVKPVKK